MIHPLAPEGMHSNDNRNKYQSVLIVSNSSCHSVSDKIKYRVVPKNKIHRTGHV